MQTAENLAPFLGHFLYLFSSASGTVQELNLCAHAVEGNRFVMEGGYFDFERISAVYGQYGAGELKDRFILIGLVQNGKTADEFVRDFRKYDTEDDWTYGLDENELREYVLRDLIPFQRTMTARLTEYGFTIYDTSTEREKVLDKIVEDIKQSDSFSYESRKG